jgi:hypothetical protein
MSEESEKPKEIEQYLLWDCFLNWSVTLEKIEKGKISKEKD